MVKGKGWVVAFSVDVIVQCRLRIRNSQTLHVHEWGPMTESDCGERETILERGQFEPALAAHA